MDTIEYLHGIENSEKIISKMDTNRKVFIASIIFFDGSIIHSQRKWGEPRYLVTAAEGKENSSANRMYLEKGEGGSL